jgi:hypothetical protein
VPQDQSGQQSIEALQTFVVNDDDGDDNQRIDDRYKDHESSSSAGLQPAGLMHDRSVAFGPDMSRRKRL